jgi:hypothetical protein
VNVERYAREFLQSRGLKAGVDYDPQTCVDLAAKVFVEENGVQLKLADLRALGAYTQFSKAEMREDVLQLLAVTGDVPGDAWVQMDAKSVKLMRDPNAPPLPDNVLNWEDVL